MTKKIKSKVASTEKNATPWRKRSPWWLVLIDGIVLAVVGLYIFFAKPTILDIRD